MNRSGWVLLIAALVLAPAVAAMATRERTPSPEHELRDIGDRMRKGGSAGRGRVAGGARGPRRLSCPPPAARGRRGRAVLPRPGARAPADPRRPASGRDLAALFDPGDEKSSQEALRAADQAAREN